jgi:hypothetical protein
MEGSGDSLGFMVTRKDPSEKSPGDYFAFSGMLLTSHGYVRGISTKSSLIRNSSVAMIERSG